MKEKKLTFSSLNNVIRWSIAKIPESVLSSLILSRVPLRQKHYHTCLTGANIKVASFGANIFAGRIIDSF